MPRYAYKCEACRGSFEINHGMFFVQEVCILCHRKETLIKLPNFSIGKVKKKNNNRPGKIVDSFIEEAKDELKKQKKQLKDEVLE